MLLPAKPPRACVKSIYTRPTKVQTRSMTKQKEAQDIDDQDAFECMCQATLANAVPLNTDLTTNIWGLRYSDHIATHGNFLFVEPLTDIESSEHSSCSEAAYLFEQARKTKELHIYYSGLQTGTRQAMTSELWIFEVKSGQEGYLMTAVHVLALATTSVGVNWICLHVLEKDTLKKLTLVEVSEKWEILIR